jgi:RNA polymerase sigma factor (TIGR02999 family)
MLPLVYDELRRIAAGYMRRERPGHTLQPTALVHEAFMRLIDQRRVDWKNRAQFIGLAAMMMRRILANHARRRAAAKRDGGADRLTVTVGSAEGQESTLDVVALHEALDRLAAIDSRKGQIVELKFFGGLTTAEIAEVMGLSTATVERDWSFARAWLYDAVAHRAT